jgi:hypothetical protein
MRGLTPIFLTSIFLTLFSLLQQCCARISLLPARGVIADFGDDAGAISCRSPYESPFAKFSS